MKTLSFPKESEYFVIDTILNLFYNIKAYVFMEKKVGRPSKLPEDRRQQINIRLNPNMKEKLALAAGEKSLSSEAERRVVESLFRDDIMDEDTKRLLHMVALEILEIQRRTHKRWHKDAKTWSAVRHMMTEGPVSWLRPDKPFDDDLVADAWNAVNAVRAKKAPFVRELENLGITSEIDAKPRTHGLMATMPGNREIEEASIRAAGLNPRERAAALDLLKQLKALDREQAEPAHRLSHALAPFREAADDGIVIYRNLRFAEAMEAVKRGEQPKPKDFV